MASRDLSRPLEEVHFTVPAEEAGARLDAWIAHRLFWRSRSDVQKRIGDGRILLDGRRARKSTRLEAGQVVTALVDGGPATEEVPLERLPLDVLFEDEHLVAIDKRAGTVVHPVGRHVNDTLINALTLRYRQQGLTPERVTPMIVHRLDRDTSGVLVFAKNPAVRKRLGADFEERRVEKHYLTVVEGHPDPPRGCIELPIGPDEEAEIKLKMRCRPDGKPSRTDYETLATSGRFALLRCHLHTGRQHQIRVHLEAVGHPIVCDALYGDGNPIRAADLDPRTPEPDRPLLSRQALHSACVRLRHPVTGEDLVLESPLPDDMALLV